VGNRSNSPLKITHLCQKEQNESQEILKNQLIQKAQQYFTNIASIFEVN
jgi:hypothetical protein